MEKSERGMSELISNEIIIYTNLSSVDERVGKQLLYLINSLYKGFINNGSRYFKLRDSLEDKYFPLYTYSINNKIIAIASVTLEQGRRGTRTRIGALYTSPEYRQMGIARFLLNRIISDYKARCDYFILDVYSFSKPAIRLYESAGFKINTYQMVRRN